MTIHANVLYLTPRFGIEKSRTQLLVSMAVGFCPTTGDAECLRFIDVLKDSAIPLPICHPNGTFTWPDSKSRLLKITQ